MTTLSIKNWEKYQHYHNKQGHPPWIKLHSRVLDVFDDDGLLNEVRGLSDSEWRLCVSLWILASRHNNAIPNRPEYIESMTGCRRVKNTLPKLIEVGLVLCDSRDTLETSRACLETSRPDSDGDSYSETDTEADTEFCPETRGASSGPPQVILTFPCDGKPDTWELTEDKVVEYEATYKTVNVREEVVRARQWLIDNPSKMKTARGMTRFLNGWLSRAVNNPRKQTQIRTPVAKPEEDRYSEYDAKVRAHFERYPDDPEDYGIHEALGDELSKADYYALRERYGGATARTGMCSMWTLGNEDRGL